MNQNNQTNHFNLMIDAIGYVNRMRQIDTKGGQSYLCCDVVALVGPSNETRNVRFDCIVTGEQAIADMWAVNDEIADLDDPKIFVSVRLSDLKAELFSYQKGDKAGQAGVALKVRLIKVNSCSIDGQAFELPSAMPQEVEAPPPPPVAQRPVLSRAASQQPARGVYPAVDRQNAAPQRPSTQSAATQPQRGVYPTVGARPHAAPQRQALRQSERNYEDGIAC